MDRHRLPPGGRALLFPAVLLALAVAGSVRVAPPLPAARPADPAVKPAAERPLVHPHQALTVQVAGHHAQRARRAPTPVAVLGGAPFVALVVTIRRRSVAARPRPAERPLALRPRAPPLPSY
jgi:hypothetical protein